jgi:hypothetical protein
MHFFKSASAAEERYFESLLLKHSLVDSENFPRYLGVREFIRFSDIEHSHDGAKIYMQFLTRIIVPPTFS